MTVGVYSKFSLLALDHLSLSAFRQAATREYRILLSRSLLTLRYQTLLLLMRSHHRTVCQAPGHQDGAVQALHQLQSD